MDLFNVLLVTRFLQTLSIQRYQLTYPARLPTPSDCGEFDEFSRHLTHNFGSLEPFFGGIGVTRF